MVNICKGRNGCRDSVRKKQKKTKQNKKEPFKGSKKVTVIQNRGRNDVQTFQQRNGTLMRHLVWNELVHFMRRR